MTQEEEILELLRANQALLVQTSQDAAKTKRYLLYSLIFTVVAFVLPLLAIIFILPSIISGFTSTYDGLM